MTGFLLIFKKFYVCMYVYVGSSLLRVGTTLCCSVRASHCGGFSCGGARALGTRASVVAVRRLSSSGSRAVEHRLSSSGSRAVEQRLGSCGERA